MNRPAAPSAFVPRATCPQCRRPTSVCYCAALPRLETRTRVVILQHPRERDMPIGTARMASLCLAGAELHVGLRWDGHPALARALADPARPAIMLYPGEGARDILREPPPGPVTLIVVDGTWAQAKVVVRDNPVLRALPRYAFAAPEPSQYRIRREPTVEVVSTIESLMYALGALEGEPERFRAMLVPFRAMVDAQLERKAREPNPRTRVPRPPRPLAARLPAALVERAADLVLIAAEANAWPYRDDAGHRPDELIHWVAYRPATGERFEALAAPAGPLSDSTPFHTRLDGAAVLAAPPRAVLLDAFARFVRPTDVIAAWGHYGPRLFLDSGGALPMPIVDLRAAAQRVARAKFGSLEQFAATLGPPPPPLGAGRAGHRVALLAQIVAAWRTEAGAG